jgi:hypothetical protein
MSNSRERSAWTAAHGLCHTRDMTIKRLDHVSVVVDDLAAAIAFLSALGMTLEGEMLVEGPWVDRVNGLESVQVDIVMMRTPDGHGRLELTKFRNPNWSRSNRRSHRRTRWASGASCLQSKASTTLSLACAPMAPNSSARWPSTRTCTDSATCEALQASSSRWPRNYCERK